MKQRRFSLLALIAPAFPLAVVSIPMQVYLPAFYADDMGIGLTAVGTAFLIARLWDIITDPVIGFLSDRWRLPGGRRRGWMVVGVPLLALGTIMVFQPEGGVTVWSLQLGLLILYLGFTFVSVNHNTLASEIASTPLERSRLLAGVHIAFALGTVTLLMLPIGLEMGLGTDRAQSIAAMGWVLILLLPVAILLLLARVPEPPHHSVAAPNWQTIRDTLRANKQVHWILIADLSSGIGLGVSAALFLFFMRDVMDIGKLSNLILLCFFVVSVACVPLWLKLSRVWGKERALISALVTAAAVMPLIHLAPSGSTYWALAIVTLMGIPSGAAPFLLRSIIGDVADERRRTENQHLSGILFALLTMSNKAGYALAIGIAFPLLDLAQFVPGATNSIAALEGMKATFVWMPFFFYLIAALAIWRLTHVPSLAPASPTHQRNIQMNQPTEIMNVVNQLYFIPALEWTKPHPVDAPRGEDPAWHIGHMAADYARSIIVPLTGDSTLFDRYDADEFKTSGQDQLWKDFTPTTAEMISWFADIDAQARGLLTSTPLTTQFKQPIEFFTTRAETLEDSLFYMVQHNAFHMGKVHVLMGIES